ncbi:hypothetical protein EP073_10350 [Geovibrio thiophilus]|uniref:Tetratricopeptide repeat protein n=1 Tax=Geovibrio thiophilus TaxID=139438 RepID=A0A410K049_9BACT|nr:hypothetical protein [Geovibrio thiophilus]QAR33790.1 hypothetical protein EP073_10350 [Geovibrio thiophilus]
MRKLFILLSALTLLLAAGCGGSSGGGSSDPDDGGSTTQTISGIVTDPAITGAQVEIRNISDDTLVNTCGVAGNLLCRTFSNDEGGFSFIVPSSFDFSLYYMQTHGGVDTETGISFESISLTAPLNAFSGDTDGIVVSPLTSLIVSDLASVTSRMSQSEIEAAVSAIRNAFGFSADTDILSNPSLEPELLHASYLLVRIASQYRDLNSTYGGGEEDPFAAIVRAVENGEFVTESGEFAAGALDQVFAEFTSAASYADVKQELEETLTLLANLSGEGNIVEELVAAEKSALFRRAVSSLVENLPATVSDTYIENVDKLLEGLEETADAEFALESFPIYQAVRFALFSDDFFGDYNSYLSADFDTALASMLAADGFATALGTIMNEASVQFVNIPLAAANLPGDNNTARADYYFNSNIDRNYLARKLISKVYDDEINDAIYLEVIYSYASYGMLEKAKRISDAFLVMSFSKATAYRYIGKFTRVYGSADETYNLLKSAEDIIVSIYSARGDGVITSDEASELILLSTEYAYIDRQDESLRLKEWLAEEIANIANETTRKTAHGRLLTAQWHAAETLVYSNDSRAEDAVDYFVELIEGQYPNTTPGKRYSIHLVYYAYASEMYRSLGLKEKVKNLFTDNIDPLRLLDQAEEGVQWQLYYDSILSDLYWSGETEEAVAVLDTLTTASAIKNTTKAITITMVFEEGFDTAVEFFERKIPMGDTFSAIGDYMDSWVYLGVNKSSTGVALAAVEMDNETLALQALTYMENKLDSLKAYIDNNSISYNTWLTLVVAGSREAEAGYVKLAEVYMSMSDDVKAAELLQKAEDYTDASTDSLYKAYAYSRIGVSYDGLNNVSKVESLLAKARTIATDNFTPAVFYAFYLNTADDYNLLGDKTNMEFSLDTAADYAGDVHTAGTTDDTNAIAESGYFRYLSSRYYTVPDMEKARNMLLAAETVSADIASASKKTSERKSIILVYAALGLVDLAYEKTGELLSTTADRYDSILDIAGTVTSSSDFSGVSIAFVDTDKDGKPDFFLPSATSAEIAASGLELDDDSDGDGKPDTTDTTPFYAD